MERQRNYGEKWKEKGGCDWSAAAFGFGQSNLLLNEEKRGEKKVNKRLLKQCVIVRELN